MGNSELEARVMVNGRLHAVKSFVYYFPECFLVIKVADYAGAMIKDLKQFEFHIKAPGADFRSIPVKGIRYE